MKSGPSLFPSLFMPPPLTLGCPFLVTSMKFNPVYEVQQEINKIMVETLPKGMLVNIQDLICKNDNDCPVFTPQVKLISFDGGHLTKEGASYLGKVVLENAPLNSL